MNALLSEPLNHAVEHGGPKPTSEADASARQPAAPVVVIVHADQQTRRKARVLELQRARRRQHPRIDYYPSPAARAAIEAVRPSNTRRP